MSESDPFETAVERLVGKHCQRHRPNVVYEVALQQWLTMRARYRDPFDPRIFARIDVALGRMPATRTSVSEARRLDLDSADAPQVPMKPPPVRRPIGARRPMTDQSGR